MTKPGLGIAPDVRRRFLISLDVVVNSSGLTDFNPDLRDALATNVRSTVYTLDFIRRLPSRFPAAPFHLLRSGTARWAHPRELQRDYTPVGLADFDAEKEWKSLEATNSASPKRAQNRRKSLPSFATGD